MHNCATVLQNRGATEGSPRSSNVSVMIFEPFWCALRSLGCFLLDSIILISNWCPMVQQVTSYLDLDLDLLFSFVSLTAGTDEGFSKWVN